MKRLLLLLLLIVASLVPSSVWAAEPETREAAVWVVNLFDGKAYQTTFAPPSAGTLYLMAGKPATLRLSRTQIYYWALNREYQADWLTRDETIRGTLEVWQDGRRLHSLSYDTYVIQSPSGDWRTDTLLSTGAAADKAFKDYEAAQDQHDHAVQAYYDRASSLAPGQAPPEQPRPLLLQSTNPTPGFVLDLAPGQYTLRVLTPQGQPVPEAERRLVVFASRRAGIGYQVIPEERWTAPETAASPAHIIYATGEQTVYLVPHRAFEVPDREYTRMLNPQSRGGQRDGWRWMLAEPLTGQPLALELGGAVTQVPYRRYQVEQMPGSALGYRVVEAAAGRPVDFGGYGVVLQPGFGSVLARLPGAPESERQIREVRAAGSPWLLQAVAAAVAVGGTGAALWRRYRVPLG